VPYLGLGHCRHETILALGLPNSPQIRVHVRVRVRVRVRSRVRVGDEVSFTVRISPSTRPFSSRSSLTVMSNFLLNLKRRFDGSGQSL